MTNVQTKERLLKISLGIIIGISLIFITKQCFKSEPSQKLKVDVQHIDTNSTIDSMYRTLLDCFDYAFSVSFDLDAYLYNLSYDESRHNYKIVNKQNCIGLFQLSPIAYADLVKHKKLTYSWNEILQDSVKQYEVQLLYMERQYDLLNHYGCYEHIGRTISYKGSDYTLTESSLYAAAHLSGVKNVKNWIDKGCPEKSACDANGTSIAKYAFKYNELNSANFEQSTYYNIN